MLKQFLQPGHLSYVKSAQILYKLLRAFQRLYELLVCANSFVIRRFAYDHHEYTIYQFLYLLVLVVAEVRQINGYQTYFQNVGVDHELFLPFYNVVQHLHDVYDAFPVIYRPEFL